MTIVNISCLFLIYPPSPSWDGVISQHMVTQPLKHQTFKSWQTRGSFSPSSTHPALSAAPHGPYKIIERITTHYTKMFYNTELESSQEDTRLGQESTLMCLHLMTLEVYAIISLC